MKSLLKQSLGITPKDQTDHKSDFLDLFAVWTEDDEDTFKRNTKDFNEKNMRDWQ